MRSQRGPVGSAALTTLPTCRVTRTESQSTIPRLVVPTRLRLPPSHLPQLPMWAQTGQVWPPSRNLLEGGGVGDERQVRRCTGVQRGWRTCCNERVDPRFGPCRGQHVRQSVTPSLFHCVCPGGHQNVRSALAHFDHPARAADDNNVVQTSEHFLIALETPLDCFKCGMLAEGNNEGRLVPPVGSPGCVQIRPPTSTSTVFRRNTGRMGGSDLRSPS